MLSVAETTRKVLFALVIGSLSVSAILPSSIAKAQDIPLLFVEPEEGLLENQIRLFLRERTSWTVTINDTSTGSTYLNIAMPVAGREMTFLVDVLDTSGVNQERRIKIYGWFYVAVKANDPRRAALLEAINTHQNENWGPRVYVDGDGDIAFDWSLNIPGEQTPIHAEQVYDAIVRTQMSLQALVPYLQRTIGY